MTEIKGTATFVRNHSPGKGEGRIYRLDPPHTGYSQESSDLVWVSALMAKGYDPETYIFACDETGDPTNWLEMPGSFRGGLDHEEALRRAGYEVSR